MSNTTPVAGETFNELLVRDEDAAAAKLAKGILHLINAHVPNIYLTEEEFNKIMPKVIEKLQSGGDVSADISAPPAAKPVAPAAAAKED